MSDEKKISACILTKNSAQTIEKCLDALYCGNRFDEILLLDTGSTDETLEIVSRFPKVKVFHQDGIENFGETRNFISSRAKNDWLLHVDSDEFLPPEFFEELWRLELHPNTVYEISRRMFYGGRPLPGLDDRVKRLYNRTATSWTNRAVHEIINLREGMKLTRICSPVEHHSYDSCDQLILKAQKYSTLFADQFAGKKSAAPWSAVLHGSWAFFRFYFLKRNLFYGYAGFITSFCFSIMSFLKYAKLYERNLRQAESDHAMRGK